MINLSSFIAFHARRTPGRPALRYRGEDISYASFDERIRKVGGWLRLQGIGEGDVVAVLMKNSAAFLELTLATSHIGAVFLPINYRLSRDEVSYIVGNAGARIPIADAELAATAAGVVPVVLPDEDAQSSVTRLAREAAPAPMHHRSPGDLMRLMYTSGTTDRPKGVMLTYENFYWKSADQAVAFGLNADTRLLVVGPLYHVGALDLPGITVLWHGGLVSILRNFDAEQALANDSEKLNAAWFAPVMTTAILTYLYLTDSKKDMIISGGENIASSEVERVICELPQVREVAVIGIPDQRWGEKPVAIVVLADGAALDLSEVVDHCRGRLAAFKVPKQLIIRDSLPRNPSGKVVTRVLRAELEADA
jgi:acyl-CoA synthetase (AMP-forming)/AMP-acid ligase II